MNDEFEKDNVCDELENEVVDDYDLEYDYYQFNKIKNKKVDMSELLKGFLIMFLLFAIPTAITFVYGNYMFIIPLLAIIPYAILGIIIWAIVRNNNRSLALGILLGSVSPFLLLFIFTGGCGLIFL